MNHAADLCDLCLKLFDVEAVNFGDFTLRGGMYTPIYFDLRLTVSYPSLLETLGNNLFKSVKADHVEFDLLCGVPYAALPLTTVISLENRIPMVMCRKEAKVYGTKKLIEGHYTPGQRCLVIDDVIVSGRSILETAKMLKDVGLIVTDAAFVLDREQGGRELLAEAGITSHCIISMSQILEILFQEKKIDMATVAKVKTFLEENNCYNLAKKKDRSA